MSSRGLLKNTERDESDRGEESNSTRVGRGVGPGGEGGACTKHQHVSVLSEVVFFSTSLACPSDVFLVLVIRL